MVRWVFVLFALLAACTGAPSAWILQGTVLEKTAPDKVIVDHDAVPGLMSAMVMPFQTRDPALFADLEPGDRIVARLIQSDQNLLIDELRVIGHGEVPRTYVPRDGGPIHAGAVLPSVTVPLADGSSWVVGADQGVPTLLTFLYTTCPLPNYCPMVASRLAALQAKLKPGQARLLAVTIDPAKDTPAVLHAYATKHGANAEIWQFGRLESDALHKLASRAGLSILDESGEIVHSLRWLVLDKTGRLLERYDDNAWPMDRVLTQLQTGGPLAPEGSDGTVSVPPEDAGAPIARPMSTPTR